VTGAEQADGSTGDVLRGEAGDDVLHARDGEPDRIDCGDGADRAILDPFDVIVDASDFSPLGSCERVERAEPRGTGPEEGAA
jgi:hypothetical protein